MAELDLNQIVELARNLRAVSDETYSAAVAVADVYNTTSSYDIGDYCIKSTLLYKCNTAIPSGEVWNGNHWDEICVSDELNELRGNLIYVGTSAPSNPKVQLWLDTDEPGISGVSSVNGATGTVVLDADDVGAVSSVNGATGTVVLDPDDVGAMWTWDLLWTNASPTSVFAAQTVSLELSDYNAVLVDCISYREELSHVNAICLQGFTTRINRIQPIDNNNKMFGVLRDAVVSTTGVEFGNAMQASVTSNGATTNAALIPYRIFGIKGVQTT